MADLSITAGSVIPSGLAVIHAGTAGATITQGQALYKRASDSKLLLADANDLTASNVVGISLDAASDGQPVRYCSEDPDFAVGGAILSVAAGDAKNVIVLSSVAGALCPVADLGAGECPVIIGVAKSTTKMVLKIVPGTALLT